MAKLLLDTPKKFGLALAQIIEDHPERWTKGAFARYKGGAVCPPEDTRAHCFCAVGLFYRLEAEGSVDRKTAHEFFKAFQLAHWTPVTAANDNKSREQLVEMLRRAAKVFK